MKKISVFGAGRSAYYLIDYLYRKQLQGIYAVQVVVNEITRESYLVEFPSLHREIIDVSNLDKITPIIAQSDLIISMLPPSKHLELAKIALAHKKSFFTASYVSKDMLALDDEVKEQELLFLNECGLDPGLDHMSAMQEIDRIKEMGGKVKAFESFAGGLVAPECINNPWGYKITWNPKNVVLAGQGVSARFYQKGTLKFIPYPKLFRRTELVEVPNCGKFEAYANRDSTPYMEIYQLHDAETVYRGTLRLPGFCKAWDQLIQLGITDDTYIIPNSDTMSYREFTNLFLAYNTSDSVEIKLRGYLGIQQDDFEVWDKLIYLGLFSKELIGIKAATPAMVLQKLVETKLKLDQRDKDRIVMHHIFEYELDTKLHKITSSLVLDGEDLTKTAMAKTVGLPLAIAADLYLQGKIKTTGVKIPVEKELYQAILHQLKESFGIAFFTQNKTL